MKKNNLLIMMFLFVLLIFVSCNKSSEVTTPQNSEEIEDVNDNEETDNIKEDNPEEVIEEDDKNKIMSTLDGLKYYKEELTRRPVAVSIDNHPGARWQAGLSQAEIIYEFEVEHPYTRYLCIFLAKEPERIGPVRSARPYIIYYALENDAIFVHVGGSPDAFSEIKRLKASEIDGLYSGSMWRYYDTNKVAPHNMYTTLKQIRDEADRKGFRDVAEFEGYKFYDKNTKLSSEIYAATKAQKIKITYNKNNSTDYAYDMEKEMYLRFKDGEEHKDELTDEQLRVKNIIVLETGKKVLDNEGRLFLGTVGNGNGIYITNGESVPITWQKKSEKERTRFYINNEELKLNKGNTWIQVVNSISLVNINN